MPCIKPAALRKGETIGIIAPSSPFAVINDKYFSRGVELIKQLGFNVVLGSKQSFSDFKTESGIAQRANDINFMFREKSISAILCAIGGYSSNDILEFLDYETIKKKPKIFIGFSDVTCLHFALLSKCNMTSFYGPMLTNFAAPDVHPYTLNFFKKALMCGDRPFVIQAASDFSDEEWYAKPGLTKRTWLKNACEVFRDGRASGILLAANLETLVSLAGTEYFPDFGDKILFLESSGGRDWREIARDLVHMRLLGAFDRIKGLVIGRFPSFDEQFAPVGRFYETLNFVLRGYRFPVLFNFSFGHTEPVCTLPIGVKCSLDTSRKSIEILEQCIVNE